MTAVAPVIPPCPWWCQNTAGHRDEYTETALEPFRLARTHSREFGDVFIVQDETNDAGAISLLPVRLCLSVEEFGDAATARRASLDLQAAADLFGRILAGAVA